MNMDYLSFMFCFSDFIAFVAIDFSALNPVATQQSRCINIQEKMRIESENENKKKSLYMDNKE